MANGKIIWKENRAGAIWKKKNGNGGFLSIQIGENKYLAFPTSKRGKKKNAPDFIVYTI